MSDRRRCALPGCRRSLGGRGAKARYCSNRCRLQAWRLRGGGRRITPLLDADPEAPDRWESLGSVVERLIEAMELTVVDQDIDGAATKVAAARQALEGK